GLAHRARWRNQQTREAQNLEPDTGVGVQLSPWALDNGRWTGGRSQRGFIRRTTSVQIRPLRLSFVRMGQCSTRPHKPGSQVRHLDPQLGWQRNASRMTRWWKRQTHEAENLGPLAGVGVQVSPWLLPPAELPVRGGKTDEEFLRRASPATPGTRHTVPSSSGNDTCLTNRRSDGSSPSGITHSGERGAPAPRENFLGGLTPPARREINGLLVQGKDTGSAHQKSEFESPAVHLRSLMEALVSGITTGL